MDIIFDKIFVTKCPPASSVILKRVLKECDRMLGLILCCLILLGLSILTASPKETQKVHEDFVPREFISK